MNIHIELVKKWLANPESVTQQELEDNRDAASDADAAAYHAAYFAAYAAYDDDAISVATWVRRYEELTK